MTEPRAGTAAKVVRFIPVLYSPTMLIAPIELIARITSVAAIEVNASHAAHPGAKVACVMAL